MRIGVDLGGTNIAVGVVNEEGRILHRLSIPTRQEKGFGEVIRNMAQLIHKVVTGSGHTLKDMKSIGVGCPGTPDCGNGVLLFACNLGFHKVPIREELQKYIDLPVYIDNDANCAALAESVAGAAKDVDHSITITLGTGIGGGVIVNRRIYSGFNNAAAEIGHMVIAVGGEQCTCGRRGCWERYASASALKNQTIAAAADNPHSLINVISGGDMNRISAKTAFDAAKKADETALRVISDYTKYVAEGLVNVINIFQPCVLVIGGGICAQGEYFLAPVRKYVKESVYCKEAEQTEIKVAEMGNDAGIVGAAMLGLG